MIKYRSTSDADINKARTVRIELVDSRTSGPLRIVNTNGRPVRAKIIAEESYVPCEGPGRRRHMNRQRRTRTYGMNRVSALWLVPVTAAAFLSQAAYADRFAKVYYDKKADQLVVTMSYLGTNPNHNFLLKWGNCEKKQSESVPSVAARVLDDQWQDAEQNSYAKTTRFNLSDLPCRRPVRVTLKTAPRYFYTLTIPG